MNQAEVVPVLLAALATARREYPSIELQTLQCLLVIAQKPGQTIHDVGQQVGLTTASSTRNIGYLATWRSAGNPGFDLVRIELDPFDRRVRLLTLTAKGHALIEKITKAAKAAQQVAARKSA